MPINLVNRYTEVFNYIAKQMEKNFDLMWHQIVRQFPTAGVFLPSIIFYFSPYKTPKNYAG